MSDGEHTYAEIKPEDALLVWLDLETTALEPDEGEILEVGVIVTDGALNEIASAQWVLDAARRIRFDSLSLRVKAMHMRSGLWAESLASTTSHADVEREVVAFLMEHVPAGLQLQKPGGAQLAGSTINFDRKWLAAKMPGVLERVHYRNLDVSSIDEMARRFWPDVYAASPRRRQDDGSSAVAHRSLDDCRAAIARLAYYRQTLRPAFGFAVSSPPTFGNGSGEHVTFRTAEDYRDHLPCSGCK